MTGASDGIGAEAARQLAAKGERLLLVGRSREKIERIGSELGAETVVADFAELDDVRTLASTVRERVDSLDVLANNAGAMFDARTLTQDGHERTFQVNYLAPVLLTSLLMEPLLAAKGSVVNTSSLGSQYGTIDLDDLEHEQRYTALRAYNDAKLAVTLFTRGLHDRFHAQGLSTVAFHPGAIATNFGSESNRVTRALYHTPLKRLFTTAAKGGANLAWFVEGTSDVTWTSGAYYNQRRLPRRTNPQALDQSLADSLWTRTASTLRLPA
ncbi:SDR family NAD(P)-dependent oxidoreductase [uncultured Amnibacterium sp.]|uniref:SDR family NAD(P)-dependent oxidoreductase n=1 Tax=uncultured Amnibacterium sp. TaxID=1631851 RepID=UPI0035CB9623